MSAADKFLETITADHSETLDDLTPYTALSCARGGQHIRNTCTLQINAKQSKKSIHKMVVFLSVVENMFNSG